MELFLQKMQRVDICIEAALDAYMLVLGMNEYDMDYYVARYEYDMRQEEQNYINNLEVDNLKQLFKVVDYLYKLDLSTEEIRKMGMEKSFTPEILENMPIRKSRSKKSN